MTGPPASPWHACLPGCETRVPCGPGTHLIRWEAGILQLPAHADAEAELVLAALGGDKARCVEIAEIWGRHTSDLSVLAVGPRGPADEIAISWADVDAVRRLQDPSRPQSRPMRPGGRSAGAAQALARASVSQQSARQQKAQQEWDQTQARRTDILTLLALGYGFGVRLTGQVAEAHAARPDERSRPALVAALAGRLAPVAEQWLGVDPGQVQVSLHQGPGWGSADMAGQQLRVSLPVGWLSRVWAPGLALAGRHLVVAVQRAGYPGARVLALRAPGAEPVELEVHAAGQPGDGDAPHWEI
jgi:hypothetical protein